MPGRLANAWVVGKVPAPVGKVPRRLAKCMGGWQCAWAGRKKCLGGWLNACAVGEMPGLVGKMSGRLAMCMGGWQCACAVGKNA